MDHKQIFKKYYARLARVGWTKSILLGLIVGFAVNFIAAFVMWLVDLRNLGLTLGVCIGAGVLAFVISTPIFYFKKFRPTTKEMAHRVDRLGLEERIITMTELENDESYIAMRQREDAKEKLKSVEAKNIAYHLSKVVLTLVCVFAALGISMTTVSALAQEGVIPGPPDFPTPGEELPATYEVTYLVEGGGYIEGEEMQIVLEGEDATMVIAVADDGWAFVGWSDDNPDPDRQDTNIRDNLTLTAKFTELSDDENDENDPDEGEAGDAENDPSDDDQTTKPEENDNPRQDGKNGKYEDNNHIIDGDQYYRDGHYDQFRQDANEQMGDQGDNLPQDSKDFVDGYYDTIK